MYKVCEGTGNWISGRAAYAPTTSRTSELLSGMLGIPVREAEKLVEGLGGEGRLRHTSLSHLLAIGINQAAATRMMCAIEFAHRLYSQPTPETIDSPQAAAKAVSYELGHQETERFVVLILNVKNRLIAKKVISVGTQTECLVSPREIFTTILHHGGIRAIIAHNHPTGALDPSPEDIAITKTILEAARVMDVEILDHLIVGNGGWNSLRASTPLWEEKKQ